MTSMNNEFLDAVQLRDLGNLSGALEILSELSKSPNAPAAVFAVLGSIQWDVGKLPHAILSFRHATEKAPTSEEASLGLFHTLLEAGRSDEAFNEMRRFLSVAESPEYRRLLSDIRQASD